LVKILKALPLANTIDDFEALAKLLVIKPQLH
jgi:hypothetical protein